MAGSCRVIGVNLTAGCRYPGQCDPLRCVIQFTESYVIATAAALPVIIRRRQQQTPAAGKLMLRRLLRMLTAFRHCLLTWRASAYIVARIQTHPDRVCPHRTPPQTDRQTDAPDLRRTGGCCCSCTCYLERFMPAGHWHDDVDQVLIEHVPTSAGTASQLSHMVRPAIATWLARKYL